MAPVSLPSMESLSQHTWPRDAWRRTSSGRRPKCSWHSPALQKQPTVAHGLAGRAGQRQGHDGPLELRVGPVTEAVDVAHTLPVGMPQFTDTQKKVWNHALIW